MMIYKKHIVFALALLACGALCVNCSGSRNDVMNDTSRFGNGLDAMEAPVLAALVAQNKLPPVHERLPENPLVAPHNYKNYKGPGTYGGLWRMMHSSPMASLWDIITIMGYEAFIRWRFDVKGLEPGLATEWFFNDDGTVFTMHIRKGLKWSDGEPYTSDAFKFFIELCQDSRLSWGAPIWTKINETDMVVETPDDTTIIMKFGGPNWLIPQWLATYPSGSQIPKTYHLPRHYLKMFHPDYNSEIKDFSTLEKMAAFHNPGLPKMLPWKLAKVEKAGTKWFFVRNPYYWMVDDLGRQLPYIDTIKSEYVVNPQLKILKMLSGDIEAQFYGVSMKDYRLFLEGRKAGNFDITEWQTAHGSIPVIVINYDEPDPELRKLIRMQPFRHALSLAIDRVRCSQLAYQGMLVPGGATTSRQSWHFADSAGKAVFREWRDAYGVFDTVRANHLLDSIGLTKRDKEGYRLRPDGNQLSMMIDVLPSTQNMEYYDIILGMEKTYRAIGIDLVIKTPLLAEIASREKMGKFTLMVREQAELDLPTYPDWVFPVTAKQWHSQTGLWYTTKGAKGIEPDEVMKSLISIYHKLGSEKNDSLRHLLIHDAVRIHIKDGPFSLGIGSQLPGYILTSKRMRNVPGEKEGITGAAATMIPASAYPEQFYLEEKKSR